MTQRKSSVLGWVPGILLIVVGAGLLFNRRFLFDAINLVFRTLDDWWPMFYVLLGVAWLAIWRPRRKAIPMMLILGGIILQVSELRIFQWWTWRSMWPLILVGMGVWMLLVRMKPQGPAGAADPVAFTSPDGVKEISGEAVDSFVVFGGLERALTSQSFRGGEATAMFGGIDLDLRRARLAPGDQRMKLFALCGGIELTVPREMNVVLQGAPILGSIEDSREPVPAQEVTAADLAASPAAAPSRLVVDGFAIFGGIEVKA